jgi:hypothetical protein
MDCKVFTDLNCSLPLEYTYKLVRGKLPEKVMLEEGRYWIPDLKAYPTLQFSIEKDGREICCIWDKKYGRYLTVCCRKNKQTNKVTFKVIHVTTNTNVVINTMHYIPICVILLGNPPNIQSISIDHINRIHSDNCLQNLRWATPTEQNMNRMFVKSEEDYYDYEYELDNIKFDSLLKVFNYCKENNRIKDVIKYENFKRVVSRCINNNKNPYSLILTRYIIPLINEEWKQINTKYQMIFFTHISNYGRVGKYSNGQILPRTITIDKSGYQRIKLKKLKSEVGIHTLVHEHFIGPVPHGYIIDHIDENKSNNHVSNLQIMTHGENIKKTMNTNKNHKNIVNIEVTDISTNNTIIFINREQFYEHFNITYGYYRYHMYKTNDNTIIINNKIYRIKEIKNRTHCTGKKRKINMIDKSGVIIQTFNSIVEISKYYKDNQINFHHWAFRQILNTNKEYNIPGVIWKSAETS